MGFAALIGGEVAADAAVGTAAFAAADVSAASLFTTAAVAGAEAGAIGTGLAGLGAVAGGITAADIGAGILGTGFAGAGLGEAALGAETLGGFIGSGLGPTLGLSDSLGLTDAATAGFGGALGSGPVNATYISPGSTEGGFLNGLSNNPLVKAGKTLSNISSIGNLAKGALGLAQGQQVAAGAQQGAATANPFGSQYAKYQQQLSALMANPSSQLPNLPGYQAGLDAVERKMAAQGYNGSGNMAASLLEYGGNIYAQQVAILEQLSGANTSSPATAGQIQAQGAVNQAQLNGNALNTLLYGTQMAAGGGSTPSIATSPNSVQSASNANSGGGLFSLFNNGSSNVNQQDSIDTNSTFDVVDYGGS